MITYSNIKARMLAMLLACASACILLCSCAKAPVGSFDVQNGNVIDPTNQNSSDDSGDYSGEALPIEAGAVDPSAIEFKNKDYYSDYKDKAQRITLSDSAKASGTGYSLSGGVLKITADGTYALSGKLSDGQIVVDAPKSADVRLVLLGVDIYCSYSAPLLVSSADKLIISLPEGTVNSFEDKKSSYETDGTEITAAIFSHESVTINGTGTINVKGVHNDGITSKDTLKIMGGIINVDSYDDGIIGKDAVIITDGKITVNAKDDAIKSTNDVDGNLGFVYIKGGELVITSDGDAISSVTSILVEGGKHTIKTGGGASSVTSSGQLRPGGSFGGFGNSSSSSSVSAKGLKAKSYLDITGGVFSMDCADDALHSKKMLRMSGGKLEISTGDDGAHADDTFSISGGEIRINKSYEGIEAQKISISGGYINITASDDGMNAAGGSDGAESGRPWQDNFASDKNASFVISGGEVHVNASGDGVDSNSDITISGGLVTVSGPTNSGNGYIDVGGSFYINGGTVIAAGSTGMLVAPSADSEQNSITVSLSGSGGDTISVTDANGKELISWVCAKSFAGCTFSSSDITIGQSYSFYVNGTLKTTVEATSVSTGGTSGMGGPGGPGGPGGQRPR